MNKKKSFRLRLIRFQTMSMRVSEKREVKFLEYKGLRKVYVHRVKQRSFHNE